MRILFWGTPDFAVPPLRAILGEGHDVLAVITQPDRARGRSRSQLDPSPVKVVALEEGLPVLQPEKPRGDAFVEELRGFDADLSVVVAYGHIMPRVVIDTPARGTVNIHASLLPALRGAAPIQAAILEGHAETGITIMQMVPALDAGPMLHVVRTEIGADENYGDLHDRLSELGAMAIIQALALIEAGLARPIPQDDQMATYAPKVTRETTRLDWTRSAVDVARVVRAFDPRPGAATSLRGAEVKCFATRVLADGGDDALDEPTRASPPGTVRSISADGMLVRCGEGAVIVSSMQPSGRARLTPLALANGRGVTVGDCFDG